MTTEIAAMTFDATMPVTEPLSEQNLTEYLSQLPGWQAENGQLSKQYGFSNFVTALAFTCQVGDLAEKVDHHPALTTEYGKVRVCWWTHTAAGITSNDLIMAYQTDQCYLSTQ